MDPENGPDYGNEDWDSGTAEEQGNLPGEGDPDWQQ